MPRPLRSSESELKEFSRRSTDQFAEAFIGMVRGIVGDTHKEYQAAFRKMTEVVGETMTIADLYGRRRVWLEADAAVARAQPEELFAATPLLPSVTFEDAFDSIVSREPRLAMDADLVAQIYQERYGFALARSADAALTGRVQDFVASFVESGRGTPSIPDVIAGVGDFTRAYAQTVYRTNLTTAYTAGRFKQAQEPGVREVLPAMERWSIRDSGLRSGRPEDNGENHAAADGLVADTRDPIWRTHAPPSGYNCRCGVRMVPRPELRRRNLLEGSRVLRFTPSGFQNFRAHERFGNRSPDALVYGSTG